MKKISIRVAGQANTGKSTIIDIINKALLANGLQATVFDPDSQFIAQRTESQQSAACCGIALSTDIELEAVQLSRSSVAPPTNPMSNRGQSMLSICEKIDELPETEVARLSMALARVRFARLAAGGDGVKDDAQFRSDRDELWGTKFAPAKAPMTAERLRRANEFRATRGNRQRRYLEEYAQSNAALGYSADGLTRLADQMVAQPFGRLDGGGLLNSGTPRMAALKEARAMTTEQLAAELGGFGDLPKCGCGAHSMGHNYPHADYCALYVSRK